PATTWHQQCQTAGGYVAARSAPACHLLQSPLSSRISHDPTPSLVFVRTALDSHHRIAAIVRTGRDAPAAATCDDCDHFRCNGKATTAGDVARGTGWRTTRPCARCGGRSSDRTDAIATRSTPASGNDFVCAAHA